MGLILIVEDSDSLRTALCAVLDHHGFQALGVESAEAGLRVVAEQDVACVVADLRLPKMDGLSFVKRVREEHPALPFLMMTAHATVDSAVEAMKVGATDFIAKPFEPERVVPIIRELLDHHRILSRRTLSAHKSSTALQTSCSELQKVFAQARLAARVDSSVLLIGESGTGKEVLARYIHENSPRSGKPFIAINCGAIPGELLESEFFGHEAGAFTGATQARPGLFEVGSEGTIFLDEVGDMPPHLQVKLLRALQEHEIRHVGSNRYISVSPRIIAATNRPLDEALAQGAVREDFYFRLAVVTLTIPPLRDRRNDIVPMARELINYFSVAAGKDQLELDATAAEMLEAYSWPGNVRELENVIERAVLVADKVIHPEDLGIRVALDITALSEASKTLEEISAGAVYKAEVEAIARALALTGGNKAKAAELLQVSYKTLLNKVKEYGLVSR
jgi:two-component system response regulator AtoC